MVNNWQNFLSCPKCLIKLASAPGNFFCSRCGEKYLSRDGQVFFIKAENDAGEKSDGLIFKLKAFIKKYPKLFSLLNHVLGIYVGKSAKRAVAFLPASAFIVNLGSGADIIREDIVNLDSFSYPGVQIVADACFLPLLDDSADAVVCQSLLEHVNDPQAVAKEIRRVLRPGGLVYLTVPFIIGFHSSPSDYFRWTSSGVRELMKDFKELELGLAVGPTNAFTSIFREWLAILLSFNLQFLYQFWVLFFMVIFAPLNLLDYMLARYQPAKNIAHIFYFIGVKK